MRLRPHLFTDSTLPPFSEAACSSVAITLSTSASGVSGRQMKIRSYWRSSMCPRFAVTSTAKAMLLLQIFFFRRDAAVELRHRLAHSLFQNRLDCIARVLDQLRCDLTLGASHGAEDVIRQVAPDFLRPYAQSNADEFIS